MSSATPEDSILVDCDASGVAVVTINRPKSLKSLTRPMIADLARAFRDLDADNSVGAVVIIGRGRAFCSGVDLTAATEVFEGDVKDKETDAVYQMEQYRKPIVAAVAGFVVTTGFEIVLACDVVNPRRDAQFVDTHARFRIFPSWGLSQKLSRIIGPNRAREVSLSSMAVTVEMAEKWGLANHVVDRSEVLKKAKEVAVAILRNHRDLVLRFKSVINDGLKLDLGHALAIEKERAHYYYDGLIKDQGAHNYFVGLRPRPPPRYSFVDMVGDDWSVDGAGFTRSSSRHDVSVMGCPSSWQSLADAVALVARAVADISSLGDPAPPGEASPHPDPSRVTHLSTAHPSSSAAASPQEKGNLRENP